MVKPSANWIGGNMKKLPVGMSVFPELIEEDYVYVDKTAYVLKLLTENKYYFLSRPRRFGKSLFLSTLKSAFQGKKELFKGLYMYDKYDFESYPVIHINFTQGDFFKPEGINERVMEILQDFARKFNLELNNGEDAQALFSTIIHKMVEASGKKVVILVDEYDKPILDVLENPDIAQKNRDFLKVFYSVLKANDEYIRFCFLTGVSKFSKVSIFSGLNNLLDISLDPQFAAVCGYTHKELDEQFTEYLEGVDREKLEYWYDGYNFYGENVYNPFDILLFFRQGKLYRNYWFETGTPTFLLKVILQQQYFLPRLNNLEADERLLNSFEIDNLNIETLLFQSGYLTIKEIKENFEGYTYVLDFPNFEVKNSFNKVLFTAMTNLENIDYQKATRKAFFDCDMEALRKNLHCLFASIPYRQKKIYTYEGYYANIIFVHFKTIGLEVNCEERSNKGRMDLLVHTPDYVCIMEFKVGKENALEQIKQKGYHEKYAGKKIILLGINFDETERNLSCFEWEEIRE